jgi:CheY-like chemotaxis protein
MKPYGMRIDTLTSGQEAVARVKEGVPRYSAIFMDHMMPEMDGLEATQAIRVLSGTYARTVPIIALTANAVAGTEQMFMENGFNGFLSKPIDVNKLDQLLHKWVRDKTKETEEDRKAEVAPSRYSENDRGTILRSFVTHLPPFIEQVKDTSDLARYAIAVHAIKGAALNIDETHLGKLAEQLEHAAKTGDANTVQARNAEFVQLASERVEAIRQQLSTTTKESRRKTEAAPDPVLLAKAKDAAESYNTSALKKALETLESSDYREGGELIAWLRAQYDEMDYDKIAEKLNEAIRT